MHGRLHEVLCIDVSSCEGRLESVPSIALQKCLDICLLCVYVCVCVSVCVCVCVSQVVEEAIESVASKALRKSLDISFHINSYADTFVRGDSERLRQILLNLLSNAIKFTKTGQVYLTVKHEELTTTHATFRFSVYDSGMGISSNDQNLLFHRFSQVDSSITREFGGTGLGLAISKEFAELMNGSIGVDSTPDVGSLFFFTAMFQLSKQQHTPFVIGVAAGDKPPTVLLVAHNETLRLCISRDLEEMGATVISIVSTQQIGEIEQDFDMLVFCPSVSQLLTSEAARHSQWWIQRPGLHPQNLQSNFLGLDCAWRSEEEVVAVTSRVSRSANGDILSTIRSSLQGLEAKGLEAASASTSLLTSEATQYSQSWLQQQALLAQDLPSNRLSVGEAGAGAADSSSSTDGDTLKTILTSLRALEARFEKSHKGSIKSIVLCPSTQLKYFQKVLGTSCTIVSRPGEMHT